MVSHVRVLGAAMVLLSVTAAGGQEERRNASPYFDCPYVNYFGPDCPQVSQGPARQDRQEPEEREIAPTAPDDSDPGETVETMDGKPRELDADEMPLLFPRETLAPDAPPLLRRLLAEPTLENARRYVRWYARRSERLRAVQALIELAGREKP
ncbi:MAG: hypothetical protein OXP66_07545 [Candidatus Tectomicrobia bacterium]|nr:hypothetical protein [Candidatus Tectomicrobia bacterium]